MHDGILSQPKGTAVIETEQKRRYPGLRVRREGEAVVEIGRASCRERV